MVFRETKLQGVFEIHLEPYNDEGEFFARCWCQKEFEDKGLNPRLVQCNLSVSSRKGTLRGMHHQAPPYEETKLVRCARGAIYDVTLDLRSQSATFKQWIAVVLTSAVSQPEPLLRAATGTARPLPVHRRRGERRRGDGTLLGAQSF